MTTKKSSRIDAVTYAPMAYNGDDPVHIIQSQFGVRMPEKMGSEFTQAFQAGSSVTADQLKAEDVWAFFKETFITPEASTVIYVTHDTHAFGDGSKFVSVSVIENNEMKTVSDDGTTCAEAVVCAFKMAGHTVTRERGVINAPGYGRKPYAIVGVTDDDGRTHFGVGISEQHQTAEIMAATRACGRAMHAPQSQTQTPRP